MGRVEDVAEILPTFAGVSLPSAIQPDQGKGKEGKTLLWEENGKVRQGNGIDQTAKQFHVDVPQGEQLSPIAPPLFGTEKVKTQDSEDSGVVVVHKGDQTKCTANQQGAQSDYNLFWQGAGVSGPLVPMNEEDGNEKTPQDVLMEGMKGSAAKREIEGKFG